MLDFRRTFWALGSGVAVVGMLVSTSVLAKAPIGHWSQGVAFTPDHQYVLVQNMVEKDIMICKLDGSKLVDTGQRLKMKGGPAAMCTAEKPL